MGSKSKGKYVINDDQVSYYRDKVSFEIDAWDLHQALKRGEKITIIDTRSIHAYAQEHIPDAISFPHGIMYEKTVRERLDLATEYVTYCDGIGCNASTKGALKLAQLGYRVRELIGGIEWWKRDKYPTVQQNLEKEFRPKCAHQKGRCNE